MIGKWTLAAALAGAAGMVVAQDVAEQFNDYPTEVRADYVFACMATNGQGADVLRRCSCSIDEIAASLAVREISASRDGFIDAPCLWTAHELFPGRARGAGLRCRSAPGPGRGRDHLLLSRL